MWIKAPARIGELCWLRPLAGKLVLRVDRGKVGLFNGMRTFGQAELCIDGGTYPSGRYFSIRLGSLLESFTGCVFIRGEGQNAGRV